MITAVVVAVVVDAGVVAVVAVVDAADRVEENAHRKKKQIQYKTKRPRLQEIFE
jgi:hypothetical protein